MHTRGTGTDYDSCQIFFMDGVNDLGLSCFGAHVLIIFRMNNARLFCCRSLLLFLHQLWLQYWYHNDIRIHLFSAPVFHLLYLLNALTSSCCGSVFIKQLRNFIRGQIILPSLADNQTVWLHRSVFPVLHLLDSALHMQSRRGISRRIWTVHSASISPFCT